MIIVKKKRVIMLDKRLSDFCKGVIVGLLIVFAAGLGSATFGIVYYSFNETILDNITVTVCSTDGVCGDVFNKTYDVVDLGSGTSSSGVVYLEGVNTSLNKHYYASLWKDGTATDSAVKVFVGRGDRWDNNFTFNATVVEFEPLHYGICYNGTDMFIGNISGRC